MLTVCDIQAQSFRHISFASKMSTDCSLESDLKMWLMYSVLEPK
jgi:hypothetical protein